MYGTHSQIESRASERVDAAGRILQVPPVMKRTSNFLRLILFLQIMNDIKRGIQYVFQTENNMIIAMSGSGHAAMECAVFNTVEPGESVLVAINGIWGERVAEIAERMGKIV